MAILLWIGAAITFSIVYLLYRTYYLDRLPVLPGPYGVPILGYMPFVGMKMNETLHNLSKTYGPVFQFQLGSRRMVAVCGQEAVKEALSGTKSADFAGRPNFQSYEGFGVFGEPGYKPSFKIYKKLTLKAMGMFANNRREELQEVCYRAVDMLLDEFVVKLDGQPVDPKPTMYRVVWTIMGYICYGDYFDKDDPQVLRILSTADEFGRAAMFGVLCDFLPWAKILISGTLKRNAKLMSEITEQSAKLAEKNIGTWDGSSLRNIADMYRKADREMDPEEKEIMQINDDTLKNMLTNLFGAGFATVAVTLKWAFLFLAKYPELQDKVQEELDRVIGDRKPRFEDEKDLAYCSAFVVENYRVSSMAALAMTHATTRDTHLQGLPIPKDIPVVFNLYSVHRDATVFPNPKEFDPDRFLKADGSVDKAKTEFVLPYGLGSRRCGGEVLAKLEIWLFFVCIMQKCRVRAAPGEILDPERYMFGLGLDPLPFKVIFESRDK